MALFRRSRVLMAAATSVLLAASVVLVAAQPPSAQRVDPNEEFRAKLQDFVREADAVFARAEIAPAWSSASVRRDIDSLTPAQLAPLREAVPSSAWTMWRTAGPQVIVAATASGRTVAGGLARPTCPEWSQADADGLLAAQSTALGFAAAWDAVVGDPTGISTAAAAALKAAPDVAVLILEQKKLKHDDCVGDENTRILQDVLGPNVDEKVSTRATQSSVDELKRLLTGMLDELKALINSRADRQESLTNTRADQQVALTNVRSDRIETLVNRRSDYADAIQKEVLAHQELALQVVEIERGRLLLIASERGVTVNVTLTSMRVAEVKPNSPVNFQEIAPQTRQNASGGVLEIVLDMRGPAKDATVYVISVAHAHGTIAPIGAVTHSGTTIFRRSGT